MSMCTMKLFLDTAILTQLCLEVKLRCKATANFDATLPAAIRLYAFCSFSVVGVGDEW